MFCWIRIITPLEGSKLIFGTQTTPSRLLSELSSDWTKPCCHGSFALRHDSSNFTHFYFLYFNTCVLLRANESEMTFPFFCVSPYVWKSCQQTSFDPVPWCIASLGTLLRYWVYYVALYSLPWIKDVKKGCCDEQNLWLIPCYTLLLVPLPIKYGFKVVLLS